MMGAMDLTRLTDEEMEGLLEMAGLAGGDLPSGMMADINEILNELPPQTTDRLLRLYYNRLFQYRAKPDKGK